MVNQIHEQNRIIQNSSEVSPNVNSPDIAIKTLAENLTNLCYSPHLWLQSRVALGHLKLDVIAGEQNPADTLTKPLPGRKIREWSEHVGQRWLH